MSDTLQSNDLKCIFMSQIKNLPKSVSLCLSGGIDSVALLSLLLENGNDINVYSFTLDTYESSDFIIAKELSKRFSCKFVPVYLPTDVDILKKDILKLHNYYECIKKTEYECTWPFLYVYPVIDDDFIITGLGAEGHFGSTKKGAIHFKYDLDTFRYQFFTNENVSQTKQHKKLCDEYNKYSYFPFLTDEIKNYFKGKTWDDINKPKLKQPIIDLINIDVSVKSGNLQIGSKISEHFDKLLDTDWNSGHYKSVVGVLNMVNRGEISNVKRKLI